MIAPPQGGVASRLEAPGPHAGAALSQAMALPPEHGARRVPEYLSRVPALQTLDLVNCTGVGDDCMPQLARLPAVTGVSFYRTPITNAGVAQLSRLSSLQSLGLRMCTNLTDASLSHIAKLSGLRDLDLSELPRITGVGVRELTVLTGLTQLRLTRLKWGLNVFTGCKRYFRHMSGLKVSIEQSYIESDGETDTDTSTGSDTDNQGGPSPADNGGNPGAAGPNADAHAEESSGSSEYTTDDENDAQAGAQQQGCASIM